MLGLSLRDCDIISFIIDVSQIVLVEESEVGDTECLRVILRDIKEPYYFTHVYRLPFYESLISIREFYKVLEKLTDD